MPTFFFYVHDWFCPEVQKVKEMAKAAEEDYKAGRFKKVRDLVTESEIEEEETGPDRVKPLEVKPIKGVEGTVRVSPSGKKEKKPIEEFLSDTSEVHALWFGFYSAWFTLKRDKLSVELKKDIKKEYQYFTAGYFIGRVIQVILVLFGINFAL